MWIIPFANLNQCFILFHHSRIQSVTTSAIKLIRLSNFLEWIHQQVMDGYCKLIFVSHCANTISTENKSQRENDRSLGQQQALYVDKNLWNFCRVGRVFRLIAFQNLSNLLVIFLRWNVILDIFAFGSTKKYGMFIQVQTGNASDQASRRCYSRSHSHYIWNKQAEVSLTHLVSNATCQILKHL